MDAVTEIVSGSPEETRRFAAQLAVRLAPGTVIALHGDLGAGKTHFVKGLADGLGLDGREVTSPTFTVVHFYGEGELVHVDAYRVKGEAELVELGFEDLISGPRLIAIEWPERAGNLLPADALHVWMEHADEATRRISIR